MKAFLTGCSMVLAVTALALSGCEGGAPAEGLPKDAELKMSPEMEKQMQINMAPVKPADIAKKKKEAEKAQKAQDTLAK
jgi:hypothetical protein